MKWQQCCHVIRILQTAAITQWCSVRLVIERLMTRGSILELAMRRCVLGKKHFTLISHWGQAVIHCGGQPDERLANRIRKSALLWCGWSEVSCLLHTNEGNPAHSLLKIELRKLNSPKCNFYNCGVLPCRLGSFLHANKHATGLRLYHKKTAAYNSIFAKTWRMYF